MALSDQLVSVTSIRRSASTTSSIEADWGTVKRL